MFNYTFGKKNKKLSNNSNLDACLCCSYLKWKKLICIGFLPVASDFCNSLLEVVLINGI